MPNLKIEKLRKNFETSVRGLVYKQYSEVYDWVKDLTNILFPNKNNILLLCLYIDSICSWLYLDSLHVEFMNLELLAASFCLENDLRIEWRIWQKLCSLNKDAVLQYSPYIYSNCSCGLAFILILFMGNLWV